jgi:hypothetical protein
MNHVRFRTSHAPHVVHGVGVISCRISACYFPLPLVPSHRGLCRNPILMVAAGFSLRATH